MKSREFDPARLEVAPFAKDNATLAGEWPLEALERLASSVLPESRTAGVPVTWSMTGETRLASGRESQTWLHLTAGTSVLLECQRCLKPMTTLLDADRSFMFVHGEENAAALDADSEDDVLAFTRHLDARELIEDELLLSLPIVPRHDVCPEPLAVAEDTLPEREESAHPFAALAALKRGGLPN